MPEQLKRYFNGISDTLTSKATIAGVFHGKGDIGQCREMICTEFLEKHVSKRFNIGRGGEIFGTNNQKHSGQIDIIINHDMSPAFKENSLVRCPIESVVAAISVKSMLDKTQLFDALKNLATIPQLDPQVLTTGALTKPFEEYAKSWPSLFVFAFSSISGEKCMEHMVSFYKDNPVPFNRIPRAVIINNQYVITYLHYTDNPGLMLCKLTPEAKGCGLFWIINEISKGLSWLNGMYVDYSKYYELAYL